MKFLIKWLINIIALMVVIRMVAGIKVDTVHTVVVAALLFTILNSLLGFIFNPNISVKYGSFRSGRSGSSRTHIDKDSVIDVEGKAE